MKESREMTITEAFDLLTAPQQRSILELQGI